MPDTTDTMLADIRSELRGMRSEVHALHGEIQALRSQLPPQHQDRLFAEQANLMRQQARTWRVVRWIGNGFIAFILLAVLAGVLAGLRGH